MIRDVLPVLKLMRTAIRNLYALNCVDFESAEILMEIDAAIEKAENDWKQAQEALDRMLKAMHM